MRQPPADPHCSARPLGGPSIRVHGVQDWRSRGCHGPWVQPLPSGDDGWLNPFPPAASQHPSWPVGWLWGNGRLGWGARGLFPLARAAVMGQEPWPRPAVLAAGRPGHPGSRCPSMTWPAGSAGGRRQDAWSSRPAWPCLNGTQRQERGGGCREQPAVPRPSLASRPCGGKGWLAVHPLFLPIFLRGSDGGSKHTAWGRMEPTRAQLPVPPASCTGPLF